MRLELKSLPGEDNYHSLYGVFWLYRIVTGLLQGILSDLMPFIDWLTAYGFMKKQIANYMDVYFSRTIGILVDLDTFAVKFPICKD